MKRAAIIFAIIFTLTTLVPLTAYFKSTKDSKEKEMVTIFSSEIMTLPDKSEFVDFVANSEFSFELRASSYKL